MRERKNQAAVGHCGQERLLLRVAAERCNQPRTQPDGGHKGLEHQRSAQGFHDGHQIKRAAIKAPLRPRKGERGQPELSQLPPGLGAVTDRRGNHTFSGFEVVVLVRQSRNRVGEQLLFFGVLKIHDQSPRAILAKMLR